MKNMTIIIDIEKDNNLVGTLNSQNTQSETAVSNGNASNSQNNTQ